MAKEDPARLLPRLQLQLRKLYQEVGQLEKEYDNGDREHFEKQADRVRDRLDLMVTLLSLN